MARVSKNIFVRGLRGSVGRQFVIRKGKRGMTIISDMPSFSEDREFNESQLAHQQAFREAIVYAQGAKDEPIYAARAADTTMSSFNAAVADWFRKPQVLDIDARAWHGAAGEVIRIQAMDDTKVARVHVAISQADGTMLEEGEAQPAEGQWWTYTANTTVPAGVTPHVTATAYDLPGNSAEMVWQN